MKPPHGGKRANSGRKKGIGNGRTAKSSSITLKPAQWAKLDVLKGNMNRSKWIAEKIDQEHEKMLVSNQNAE